MPASPRFLVIIALIGDDGCRLLCQGFTKISLDMFLLWGKKLSEALGLLGKEVLNHSVVDGIVLGVVVVALLAILDVLLNGLVVVLGCWGVCWPGSFSMCATQTPRRVDSENDDESLRNQVWANLA